jgi:hypothetical protein
MILICTSFSPLAGLPSRHSEVTSLDVTREPLTATVDPFDFACLKTL